MRGGHFFFRGSKAWYDDNDENLLCMSHSRCVAYAAMEPHLGPPPGHPASDEDAPEDTQQPDAFEALCKAHEKDDMDSTI
jgi:hypothetical protein